MERKSQYKVLFQKRNALNDFINYKRAYSALSNPNINGNKKLKEVYDIFLVEEIKQDTLTAA